jgi:hypothetical protein
MALHFILSACTVHSDNMHTQHDNMHPAQSNMCSAIYIMHTEPDNCCPAV